MAEGMVEWRAAARSAAEQELAMLERGELTDCTFHVSTEGGDAQEFRLHRLVLARASPVFQAMLLPSGEGLQEAHTGHVTITDTEPRIFSLLLRHVYGDQRCSADWRDLIEMAKLADKYQMPLLTSMYRTVLCRLLSVDSVWSCAALAEALPNMQQLEEACLKFLCAHTAACLAHPDFPLLCSETLLVRLLERDHLAVARELTLLEGAVRWAQPRRSGGSSVRDVLEPRVLPLLRLATINPEIISLLEWLTPEEKSALASRDPSHPLCKIMARRIPPEPPVDEQGMQYVGLVNPGTKDSFKNHFRSIAQLKGDTNNFTVRANRALNLCGLRFITQSRWEAEGCCDVIEESEGMLIPAFRLSANEMFYTEELEVIISTLPPSPEDSTVTVALRKEGIKYDSGDVDLMFPSAVPLQPNVWYQVSVRLGKAGFYDGNNFLSVVVRHGGVDFELLCPLSQETKQMWKMEHWVRGIFFTQR